MRYFFWRVYFLEICIAKVSTSEIKNEGDLIQNEGELAKMKEIMH